MTANDSIQLDKLLKTHYDIEGTITELDGEVDLNFKVVAKDVVYLLKICQPDIDRVEIDFQVELLNYLGQKSLSFDIPSVIPTNQGAFFFTDDFRGTIVYIRLHSWVHGTMLSEIFSRTNRLYSSWGRICGELSKSLVDFDHAGAHRFNKWNPIESLYSKRDIQFFDAGEKQIANHFWDLFEEVVVPIQSELRWSVNYSDAHEHNLMLNGDYERISGVIDFGDAIYGPTISELAIACAYAGMYVNDPIESMFYVVHGYHSVFPLEEKEAKILFPLICARLMITVANAAKSKSKNPDNTYLQISAEPAWNLLKKLKEINLNFAHYYFRSACNWEACPQRVSWNEYLAKNKKEFSLPIDIAKYVPADIDLSVGSLELGGNNHFENEMVFSRRIDKILLEKNADLGIGGYCEVRPFYTTDAYKIEGNNGYKWRTMHLGKDYWMSAGEPVYAVHDGVVHSMKNNDAYCDYGPTIIVEHQMSDGELFYTLYGHLSVDSIARRQVGDEVKSGEAIANVGDSSVNGGWPPHLHFQMMLDLMGNSGDFPGVCFVEEAQIWSSICPDLNLENSAISKPQNEWQQILKDRSRLLGRSLSVSYDHPLHMVRGYGQYLYDVNGRRYLDTVNNVAHVGHEHPRVVAAASNQMGLLNTNTRYLHKNITEYAAQLLSKCPESLDTVYFVNSGSEANELALRMAKTYSGQKDIIAIESGYHGNTGATIDVSSYKFDGKGGQGAPEHTHIVPIPDIYRGKCKDENLAAHYYSEFIVSSICKIKEKGRSVAGFLAESILSCGGQIVLPKGYLKEVYKLIRDEGGLCISDEVQVGFGRVGTHYWGFELQDVVPDIITCGKPIGNGHPLGAVITSKKVAEAFTNGMEYFNTFGGNPVSCAVGNQVLKIIDEEALQENALKIGNKLLNNLNSLKDKHSLIGDVRGKGLFCGFELVRNTSTLEPADKEASYIANRMRALGILMSTDGPLHNVIKIKPPMCFTEQNVEELISRLDRVLSEVESIDKLQTIK